MELRTIDTKALSRELNLLKRKYDKLLVATADVPMSDPDRDALERMIEQTFKNMAKDITMKLMDEEEDEGNSEEIKLSQGIDDSIPLKSFQNGSITDIEL